MKTFLKIFLLLFFLIIIDTINAQPITWQRTYGGPGIDYGYSIVQTPDGGYIAAGRKGSNMYIMRLNSYGDTIWTKSPPLSWTRSVIKTNDNNYVVLGLLGDAIKININGDSLWYKAFDPMVRTGNIKQTSDNNFIICGCKQSGAGECIPYLLKINSNGGHIYEKSFTSFWKGNFIDITLSQDGEYVMCGNYSDSGFISGKLFIIKTDTMGNQIWFQRYDTLRYYSAVGIVNSDDGGYAVAIAYNRTILCKFNSLGEIVWLKPYFSLIANIPNSITSCIDGGYALTGTRDSTGNSDFYVYLLKTDSQGSEQWNKMYGYHNNDAGHCVRQTSDSGYIINGIRDNFNSGDIYIIKTDKNGYANPSTGIKQISNEFPRRFELQQNYPNPFNPKTLIKFQISDFLFVSLKVYDMLGREVKVLINEKLRHGIYEIEFMGNELPSGIYLYRFEADGKYIDSKKMILLK